MAKTRKFAFVRLISSLLFGYTVNGGRALRRYSDDGLNRSEHIDVTKKAQGLISSEAVLRLASLFNV